VHAGHWDTSTVGDPDALQGSLQVWWNVGDKPESARSRLHAAKTAHLGAKFDDDALVETTALDIVPLSILK
jgi:hypothetical protein